MLEVILREIQSSSVGSPNSFHCTVFVGEEINVLHAGNMNKGSHNFVWNGKNQYHQNVPSGLYFLHIASDNFNFTTKMTLLK